MRKASEKSGRKRGKSAPVNEVGDGLEAYRAKRDPKATNEPFAVDTRTSGRTLNGRFVVHQHAATRMHYDVRIQIGNALRSFAVPRGPSLDPAHKRLAVLVEDHPLEYLDFEDVIPEGNYGAGAMIAWDTGRVSYLEGSAEEGLARGKIDLAFSGFKLKGRFGLIKTKRDPSEWLLVKKQDEFCEVGVDLIERAPRSVLSGLTVSELYRASEVVAEQEAMARSLGARERELDMSGREPMLCSTDPCDLDDPERLYELKLDGVRIVAEKHGQRVNLRYRNGRPATANYPEIARAVRALPVERIVLDGEIVAFDAAGKPSFQRILPRIQARRPLDVERVREQVPVVYLVFDLLQFGPLCLTEVPLVVRKRFMLQVVQGKGYLQALDHLEGTGSLLFELAKRESLEGVVAKRKRSKYQFGPVRTDDWVKCKTEREDDFVVVGHSPSRGQKKGVRALCVASYRGEDLVFRGRVGSGLSDQSVRILGEQLRELEQVECPCVGELPPDVRDAKWVRPELVVSVRYLGWADNHFRHPVFRGVRPDVDPRSCTARPTTEIENELEAESPASELVQLSNQDKVFWPDEGYTKGDLCDFYAAVSDVMLPFLQGRPVVLVRYPDGIAGKSFYQWRAPAGTPDWIRTFELRDDEEQESKGEKRAFLLDNQAALVHIANLGCIPIHVLACREHSRQLCDFLTIDLDIGEQPFKHAVVLALTLRELLAELDLEGFPKTSGQKGMHVLIPTGGIDFDSAKLLVELIGRLLVARHADIATMERRVNKRGPKVYVDTGQTGHSRTIVAPYSVRATPGATVSTPLLWDEVHVALDPSRFTMFTVPERVARLGDPMAGLLRAKPDIRKAVSVLGSKLG